MALQAFNPVRKATKPLKDPRAGPPTRGIASDGRLLPAPKVPNLFSGPDPPRVAAWFGAWFFFSLLASGAALGLRGTGQVNTNYFSVL